MQRSTRCVALAAGLSAILFFLPACGAKKQYRPALYAAERQSLFTAQQQAVIERECGPFGLPRREWDIGHTDYIVRDQYVLEHSPVDRIPLWVAEHMNAGDWEGNAPRPDAKHWKADADLPADGRAKKSDYASSGYDRGHMAPNGDFGTWDDRLATFVLSNAVPQFPTQNQGVWNQLEEQVRRLINNRGEGYVITGPMFYEAEEDPEGGSGGDGSIEYFVIGGNNVAVPTHTFKIVAVPNSNGGWDGYAFVIANTAGQSAGGWTPHMKSIDWIERRCGFDFFPNLTGADEAAVESNVLPLPFTGNN